MLLVVVAVNGQLLITINMPSNISRYFKNLFLPSLFELWLW